MLEDYVVAGYFLTRPIERSEGQNDPALVPQRIVTAAPWPNESLLPDSWCVRWSNCSPQERERAAAAWGIEPMRVEALVDWVTAGIGSRIHVSSLCVTLDDLRALVGLAEPHTEAAALGMALPKQDVVRYLANTEPPDSPPGVAPRGRTEFAEGLSRGVPPDPSGRALGHEILGLCEVPWASNRDSWLAFGLERPALEELGVATNEHGMIESLADARRVAAWIDASPPDCTPGPWFSWLLIRYDLARGA